jgi:hypothetical protein
MHRFCECSLTPPFVELDLVIIPGDNGVITVTVTDDDGDPVDLTGADITFTVKADLGEDDPGIFQLGIGTGIELADQDINPGVFTITIPAEDTAPPVLQPGLEYQHRTRLTLDSVVTTLLGGTLILCR